MTEHNRGNLGFVLPVAGLIPQEYLWHFYQGLAPISRRMIAFCKMPRGWMQQDSDLILLSSPSLVWKVTNRLWRTGGKSFDLFARPGNCIPVPPLGWQRRFMHAIAQYDIGALLIIYGGCGVTLLPALEKIELPIAVLFCGSDAQVGDRFPWYAGKLRQLWQRADRCIFASNFLFEQALARGLPSEKSCVIYLGTAVPRTICCRRNDSKTRFICVGSLLPVKGQEFLIRAFDIVRRQKPDVSLTLVGDGCMRGRLQNLVNALGLNGSVEFTGYIEHDQVQKKLAESDVYVQPSVRSEDGQEEAISQAVLEAQAWGLPAVVFRSGGLHEAVEDGNTGLVVTERDVPALADAMLTLATDQQLHNSFSISARKRIEQSFDLNKQNVLWRSAIEELMNFNKDVCPVNT